MENVKMSDPFTGLELNVKKLKDNSIIVDLPNYGLSTLVYNQDNNTYSIPANYFEYQKMVSASFASDYLSVSKMRISRMCSSGVLKSVKINGSLLIDFENLKDFKNARNSSDMDISS